MQSFGDIIACDIHPACNLRILNYLTKILTVYSEQKLAWYRRWIVIGFEALETLLDKTQYCFGEQPTLADVYLIPQVYNALRFEVDITLFPKIMNAYQNCNQLDAFIIAKPENQRDTM